MSRKDETSASASGAPSHPLTIRSLVSQLLWPGLLRSTGLALRPARLGMATILLVLLALVLRVPDLWLRRGEKSGWADSPSSVVADHAERAGDALFGRREPVDAVLDLLDAPAHALRVAPWSVLAICLPVLAIWGVLGGAIARSAATEHGLGRRLSWTTALTMGVSRWVPLTLVHAGPLVFIGSIAALLMVLGYIGFSVPFVQIVAGALFVVGLVLAAMAVIVLAGLVLGLPLLVPAIVCEGCDAIDGVQRVLAYAVSHPLRLAMYLAILLAQLSVSLLVLAALVQATREFAAWSASLLLKEDFARLLREQVISGTQPGLGDYTDQQRLAGDIAGFWGRFLGLLVPAFAVSYFFSSGSILYLTMRRLCDGQDKADLWSPEPARAGAPAAATEEVEEEDL